MEDRRWSYKRCLTAGLRWGILVALLDFSFWKIYNSYRHGSDISGYLIWQFPFSIPREFDALFAIPFVMTYTILNGRGLFSRYTGLPKTKTDSVLQFIFVLPFTIQVMIMSRGWFIDAFFSGIVLMLLMILIYITSVIVAGVLMLIFNILAWLSAKIFGVRKVRDMTCYLNGKERQ